MHRSGKRAVAKRFNATGFDPVIRQFESDLPLFEELISVREYVEGVLDDMWYGRIIVYPKDFEKKCSRDEALTDLLFEKFGRSMGIIVNYLRSK